MFLEGYGPLILAGTWQTVKLAVLSLAFAFALGLVGAAAKLSKNRPSRVLATGYTLHYPFVDRELLDWSGMAPDLYLNVLSRRDRNLFVLGMIEIATTMQRRVTDQQQALCIVVHRIPTPHIRTPINLEQSEYNHCHGNTWRGSGCLAKDGTILDQIR